MNNQSAKALVVKPISSTQANTICKKLHYSKKVVPNSQLHLGVFYNGICEGVMQFGPPMSKRRTQILVKGTKWNGFLELNRMAFSEVLPKNSESRAISIALRLIRKHYPHVEWILSFADGTQCGDGTIYRASGFKLCGIKENKSIVKLPTGEIVAKITYGKGKHILKTGGPSDAVKNAKPLDGYQLRYIYFLNKEAEKRLTVKILPFDTIKKLGASMYKGKKRATSIDNDAAVSQIAEGGASPTVALHSKEG